MKNNISLHFLGAAGAVTGSKYLLDTPEKKFLVDCGLFQGLKELRMLNWDALPVDVSTLDYVFLTHGHLDHVGYLPRLVKAGFQGKIFGSAPTLDIAGIVLLDSAKIQEEDAEHANKHKYSKHRPAKPLYDIEDAEKTLQHFQEIKINEWLPFGDTIQVRYQPNGHILGSCFIEIHISGKKFVFSGDAGQVNDLLLYPPKKPQEADYVLVESTYGDRLHPHEDIKARLKKIILETHAGGGTVIIPSFAVERTQTLMYLIWQLRKAGEIPGLPFIMDSPMGANVLEVFSKHSEWDKLSAKDCTEMCAAFEIVRDFQETKKLVENHHPKIVIAGSGMLTGGRVLTYLQEYLGRPETTLLFVGYQGEGTRGRQLLEGAHEIKMYGKYYPVKARKEMINGLSAHGDQKDLLNWLSDIKNKPQQVFIIHGEKHSADAFRVKVTDTFGWECQVPHLFDIFEIPLP